MHDEDQSLLKRFESRACGYILQPLTTMATSLYMKNILEWEIKRQTNKQRLQTHAVCKKGQQTNPKHSTRPGLQES